MVSFREACVSSESPCRRLALTLASQILPSWEWFLALVWVLVLAVEVWVSLSVWAASVSASLLAVGEAWALERWVAAWVEQVWAASQFPQVERLHSLVRRHVSSRVPRCSLSVDLLPQ